MIAVIGIIIGCAVVWAIFCIIANRLLKPNFYMADTFLSLVSSYRTLWLAGRFGGGKTSLAIWIAAQLYASGRVNHIHANVPSAIACDPHEGCFDAALVMDEAHLYLEEWRVIQRHMAFLRKRNQVLLMPSVFPPSPRLRLLTCQRTLNLMTVGLKCWVYTYNLQAGNISEKGRFFLFHPQHIYRYYDTEIEPDDDGGIFDAIRNFGEEEEQLQDEEWDDLIAAVHKQAEQQATIDGVTPQVTPDMIERKYDAEIKRRIAAREAKAAGQGQRAAENSSASDATKTLDESSVRIDDATERLSDTITRISEKLSNVRKR